ncbi:MAG: hypothetical protein EOP51_16080, partial [Sphingobacteriales bacterium]
MPVHAKKLNLAETLTPFIAGLVLFGFAHFNWHNPYSVVVILPFIAWFVYRVVTNAKGKVLIEDKGNRMVFYGIGKTMSIDREEVQRFELRNNWLCRLLDLNLISITTRQGEQLKVY